MTPERWQEVEKVLQTALDYPKSERVSFVDEACAGDEELKTEAISLLDAHDSATEFIEEPAISRDAHLLIGPDDAIGNSIGPYQIIERIGSGGMGDVYLAEDSRLHRRVALKILPEYFASDGSRLHRFQREARAASALNHPNIITIHEVGKHQNVHFIAIEFVEGRTLRELIHSGELSRHEIVEIAEQVASALDAAHQSGIVHRDVKPENIMRRADGLVKILDFGIAKLLDQNAPASFGPGTRTEFGIVMGTVDYMSPEQARGLPVDGRSDVWSLGVVLYEMLAGELPFDGPTRMDTIVAILERQPSRVLHSGGFDRVITKALQKSPDNRYQSAAEMLADLNEVKKAITDPDFKESVTLPHNVPTSTAKRNSIWLAILLVVVISVAFGAFMYRRSVKSAESSRAEVLVPVTTRYSEMNEEQRVAFVREQEQRVSQMLGENPQKLDADAVDVIKRFVDRYARRTGSAASGVGKDSLETIYTRAVPYVPAITRSFTARKVPAMIGIYLPMIESEYRECLDSPLGAKGMFQFLPQTAQDYGVARSEMCDVNKMAPAAANYIADRMAELGEDAQSQTLVLLSYNRGSEAVRDALLELRGTENYQRSFWTLFANRNKLDETFRQESAWYVPAFYAAAIVGENPQRFGLSTPPLSSLAEKPATN